VSVFSCPQKFLLAPEPRRLDSDIETPNYWTFLAPLYDLKLSFPSRVP
jgi:hypothetical protein